MKFWAWIFARVIIAVVISPFVGTVIYLRAELNGASNEIREWLDDKRRNSRQ